MLEPEKLLKFILEGGIINEAQFKKVLDECKKSGKDAGQVLVANNLMSQKDVAKIEAYLLGAPFVNLEEQTIPLEILTIIPESIARSHNVVAFKKTDKALEVAMLDPQDLRTIEFLEKSMPTLKILPRLATMEGIKSALSQYQKTLDIEFKDIIKPKEEETPGEDNAENETAQLKRIEESEISDTGNRPTEAEEAQKAAKEVPIIKIVDTLLKHAILQGASDVHIEPLEKEVIVRYRIDGILHDVMTLPITTVHGIVARIKVLANLKLDETRLPQDGRFKVETEYFKYSVRVSILPVINGEKIVMRLLEENTKSLTLENLGFTGAALKELKESLTKASGMILITGPTGSGKTTTLYSMMEILNTKDVNISTVEDPIEYRMPRINQTQVNSQIGLTFSAGLRVLVRQDPDIIMVGEIRDQETAELAVNAALTGHLVLSTLHTTEAAGTIPRLIDMKTEPFLLSSTLCLIAAQRLVRKFTNEKEKYVLSPADIKNLSKYCDLKKILDILKQEKIISPGAAIKDLQFYRPKISKSGGDGYKGRIAIAEVLPVTEGIRDLIIKRASTKEIAALAIKEGMRTMIEDGFVKAAQGLTSIEEVLRVITE